MVLRGLGPGLICRLMRAERDFGREPESDWLLFGPTSPEVIDDDAAAPGRAVERAS